MDPYLILYFWSLQPGSGGHESTCTHVPFVALLYRYSSSRLIGLPHFSSSLLYSICRVYYFHHCEISVTNFFIHMYILVKDTLLCMLTKMNVI
jgi:hypothetical protein